jgi:hypothetical protein
MSTNNDSQNSVASAITYRIINQHVHLLSAYGVQRVYDAIVNEATRVGDVEEIGSSDVSCWVNNIINELALDNVTA